MINLPYTAQCTDYFAQWADTPWAMVLDSCGLGHDNSRRDILVGFPYKTLVTEHDVTTITNCLTQEVITSHENKWDLLADQLNAEKNIPAYHSAAIGICSYDNGAPEFSFGFYDELMVIDHQQQTATLNSLKSSDNLRLPLQPKPVAVRPFCQKGEWTSNMTFEDYREQFLKIQQHLFDGDCYQINLAQRFQAEFEGDPWTAYLQCRQKNPAPFSAYLHLPTQKILSCSPERFLRIVQDHVETKPIKGTKPRGITPEQDREFADALLRSEKDRAENIMIVDLLRNDLSKNCLPGSVKVPKCCELETFASVHHLVSTIIGELVPGRSSIDLLRDAFPGGSITGAPKRRAMEIIKDCEPDPRGIYCGSIVYLDKNGDMDSNITIRTLACMNNQMYCSAGGALVADSNCEAEYQETLDKISIILGALKNV